jgi:hypothetical protein
MPINLELRDDEHVLKLDIISPWNLNELMEMYATAKQYFDKSTVRLDTLVDISKMGSIPPGALRARNSPFLSHARSGYQIVVGANMYAKSMAEMLFRLTNYKRTRFFTTMDAALEFLHSEEAQAQAAEMGAGD